MYIIAGLLFRTSWKHLLETKGLCWICWGFHFRRKQILFCLHCTIFILVRSNINLKVKLCQNLSRIQESGWDLVERWNLRDRDSQNGSQDKCRDLESSLETPSLELSEIFCGIEDL